MNVIEGKCSWLRLLEISINANMLFTFIVVEFVVVFFITFLAFFILLFFAVFLFTCLSFLFLLVFLVILRNALISKQVHCVVFVAFKCKTPVSCILIFITIWTSQRAAIAISRLKARCNCAMKW